MTPQHHTTSTEEMSLQTPSDQTPSDQAPSDQAPSDQTLSDQTPSAQKSSTRPDVHSRTAAIVYYDIESLHNIFSIVALAVEPTTQRSFLNIYHLIDDEHLRQHLNSAAGRDQLISMIMKRNPTLEAIGHEEHYIKIYDLHDPDAVINLAQIMAVSAELDPHSHDERSTVPVIMHNHYHNDHPIVIRQNLITSLTPVVCDTHPQYDPTTIQHGLCAGYNSYNYDTTMLAIFFAHAFAENIGQSALRHGPHDDQPIFVTSDGTQCIFDHNGADITVPTAYTMRMHNDKLFQEKRMPNYVKSGYGGEPGELGQHPENTRKTIAEVIRNNMLKSGRHMDVARFNEVQSMTGLKRHLGQLGHQILESDNLDGHDTTITTIDDLYELLVYNVSDVVGLKLLFEHPIYSSSFDQRAQLLQTYPECIYKKKKDAYEPDIRNSAVDPWRLTVDSSSAQFVARVLAPYSQLDDIPVVSFDYPHPYMATELGIEQFNVLDEAKKFFYDAISDEDARRTFDNVYNYYKSIEGKNFNDTLSGEVYELKNIPTLPNNIPYFHADGSQSTGFVTFSTGGIHGAEYFREQFDRDMTAHHHARKRILAVREACNNDPVVMRDLKTITIADPITGDEMTVKRSEVLTKITSDHPEWKKMPVIADKEPELFKTSNRSGAVEHRATQLNKKYNYTSLGNCIHEDFTSYYPLLLKNMRAFYNKDLGEDRYSEIFYQKEKYGVLQKDMSLTQQQRDEYAVLRNGTKLLLNAASGAGDASFKTSIRMNNRIISMRIIGQLFLWRIGQAQTLAGATIISTNTDGIYSAKIDPEKNNAVLREQYEYIRVDIEPEPLTLVSKDSNNRVEFYPARPGDTDRTVAAAGGALACYKGPNPTKRLKDQAITQYIIVEYFKQLSGDAQGESRLQDELTPETVHAILDKAHATMDTAQLLTMYQMIIASSPSVGTYLYRTDYVSHEHNAIDNAEDISILDRHPTEIGKNNRIFIVDPDKALAAGCSVYNIAAAKSSAVPHGKKRDEPHCVAEIIYGQAGVSRDYRMNRKLFIGKHTGLDPHAPVIIHNYSLHHPPQDDTVITPEQLLEIIDRDAYVDIAINKFNSDWRNVIK